MYLTYIEYQNMGGTLDETAFTDIEFEAETIINYYTFNRLKNEEEQGNEVKLLMMYLIRNITIARNSIDSSTSASEVGDKVIVSQSNDGVSTSYNVLSQKEILDANAINQFNAVHRYLNGVKNSLGQLVLYRGVYPNE